MPPHAVQSEQVWDVQTVQETPNRPLNEKVEDTDELVASKRKKSVSFRDHVTYREIAPITEMSKEEIRSIWYNDDEYAKIKKHVSATVKKANKGEAIREDKGYCMRGLEGRTKFGAKRRKNNKAKALECVWNTQITQWRSKMNNPAEIAAAYKPHSVRSKYPAIEAAHNDEAFVKTVVRVAE